MLQWMAGLILRCVMRDCGCRMEFASHVASRSGRVSAKLPSPSALRRRPSTLSVCHNMARLAKSPAFCRPAHGYLSNARARWLARHDACPTTLKVGQKHTRTHSLNCLYQCKEKRTVEMCNSI